MLMVERHKPRTDEEWAKVFSKAREGHILWDGWAEDPYDPRHAITSARQFVAQAQTFGFFRAGNRVFDLGCGNGRFGIVFSEMNLRVLGMDPVKSCIDFCKWAFAPYPNVKFQFVDLWNEVFNPSGKVAPIHYRIDADDGEFDDVIAYSVFTHLQTVEIAAHYMDELRRVLKPSGKLFITWYRSPPDPDANPTVGRTVYRECDIMSMMHGFRFDMTYGGHTGAYYDQWGMFCTKA